MIEAQLTEAESNKDGSHVPESWKSGIWDPIPNPQWDIIGVSTRYEELGSDPGYLSFYEGPDH